MGFSLGAGRPGFQHDPPYGPEMLAAQERVRAACQANKVAFLSSLHSDDWQELIAKGVRVSGARDPAFAAMVRRHTGRTMPV
jgi:hypothetical protein